MTRLCLGAEAGFCSALLFLAACHHGHHGPRQDAAIEPVDAAGDAARDAGTELGDLDAGTRLTLSGQLNVCPRPSLLATPLRTPLDQPVVAVSLSVDPEGNSLAVQWTATPDGRFDDPSAQLAHYSCEALGPKTLHLRVVDALGCASTDSLQIDCVDQR